MKDAKTLSGILQLIVVCFAVSSTQMLTAKDTAYPVSRQDRHFYFRLLFLEELFSLSRKASNATIKLPKDINNANISMKIEMIS